MGQNLSPQDGDNNMRVCYGGDVTTLRYWNEILAVYVTQFTGAIGDK